jgi:hypothetical protein
MVFLLSGILNGIQRSEMLLLPSLLCSACSDLSIDDSCQKSSALSLLSLFESSLQHLLTMPIYYILSVLMPSSLLYFPSMTSIHCLLNICQQSPPLALMESNTSTHMHSDSPPGLFSPPLTSMSKKKHAPP